MINAFGQFLRELRHLHAELLKDMADKLDVSSAFLSSVETGKKSIPPAWGGLLSDLYSLSASQRVELSKAIDKSQRNVTIDLSSQSGEHRGFAVAFARQFNNLSDDDLEVFKKAMASMNAKAKDK